MCALAKNAYIPTLDGWRAVAILLVIVQHSIGALGKSVPVLNTLGTHGVGIFFVLSGYLITDRLLEDDCNLRRFYPRRAFRILPLVFLYCAVLAMLSPRVPLAAGELKSSILFVRNYTLMAALPADGSGWFTLHFWSLALEEQFYLVWPCLLLLAGTRRARAIVLCGAVMTVIWRILCGPYAGFFYSTNHAWIMRPEFHCDGILVGCALALYWQERRVPVKVSGRLASIPLLVWIVLVIFSGDSPIILESIAAAGMIAATVLRPQKGLGRILETAPVKLIGRMSYGIYVWQQLFLWPPGMRAPIPISNVALRLAALFLVSWLCYSAIERPSLRFGRTLAETGASVRSVQVA